MRSRQIVNEESKKTWIKCRNGWIAYTPIAGNKVHITATGHNQHIVGATGLNFYLDELARALGGRVTR
jgi:hypothetical protein